MLNQVWPDNDRCCWEWRCISGGLGALLHHQSKYLPAIVTVKISTLRGTVWPGVSPCSARSSLAYLLSCTCSAAWSTYLFTWQREFLFLLHLTWEYAPGWVWESHCKLHHLCMIWAAAREERSMWERAMLCSLTPSYWFADQNVLCHLILPQSQKHLKRQIYVSWAL